MPLLTVSQAAMCLVLSGLELLTYFTIIFCARAEVARGRFVPEGKKKPFHFIARVVPTETLEQ